MTLPATENHHKAVIKPANFNRTKININSRNIQYNYLATRGTVDDKVLVLV